MMETPFELKLGDLILPPGFRVTIHLGEQPAPSFPPRPRPEYSVPEPSIIAGAIARVEVWCDGLPNGSITVKQECVDTVAELVQDLVDRVADRRRRELEEAAESFGQFDPNAPTRLVEIYCTKCGYNLMENYDTAAKVPCVLRMTEQQIDEVNSPSATCGVCGGQMGARDVPEPERPKTKVYQFPRVLM